jgi:hypothetical protein
MCPILIVYVVWKWLLAQESLALWLEGLALVAIFGLELKEYRRQGADRIAQHKESADQMAIMQSQADAATANAEAASLNAEAAKQMLGLIINKERARLRVIHQLEFLATTVEYSVRLYGSTEAQIIDSGAEAYVHNSPDLPSTSFMLPMTNLPQVLTPENRLFTAPTFIFPNLKLTRADVDSLNERKSFLYFRGFIRYKDVFDRERETKFQYLWTVSDIPGLDGKPYSYWNTVGGEDHNVET